MLSASFLLAVLAAAVAAQQTNRSNNFPHDYPGKPSGDFSPQWQSYFEVTESLTNVSFDLGRQFAGNIPVQRPGLPNNTLFFWGFERENGSLTAAAGERSNEPWAIWLNGGPGSSSMLGMFYENGPIHIADDFSAYQNNYSWDHLADYIWIDQPVGVGYSTVQDASWVKDEDEMGRDFIGFLDNLVKVFPSLRTRPLYLTGESYAGVYIPYITKTYFGLSDPPVKIAKIAIGDGAMNTGAVFEHAGSLVVLETFPQLIGYDPEVYSWFKEQHHLCGYDVNLTYPQTGLFPTIEADFPSNGLFADRVAPGMHHGRLSPSRFLQDVAVTGHLRGLSAQEHGEGEGLRRRSAGAEKWKRDLSGRANGTIDEYYGCYLLFGIEDYALNYSAPWNLSGVTGNDLYNGFDVYNVPDALNPETPQDANVFMNDNKTRAALHAPTSKNFVQSQNYQFTGGEDGDDPSPVPMVFFTEMATNASQHGVGVIIYSGNNDALVPHWGSEITIQNTTFGGIQGFTKKPATPWTTNNGTFAGIVHQERNWTYVLFSDAGHLVPQQKLEAALVFLREFVLGSNTTGLVGANGNIQGGQDSALLPAALPGASEIYYGSGTTSGTWTAPSATRAAWDSFLASATANRFALAASAASASSGYPSAPAPSQTQPSGAEQLKVPFGVMAAVVAALVFA